MISEKKILWRQFVLYATLMVAVMTAGTVFGQVEVIEFNAGFNAANGCPWVDNLTDCDVEHIDIAKQPDLQKKYSIFVVPTIIVFYDEEEVKRFQANIMMQMEATKEEVQEAIDNAAMSAF